MSKNCSRVYNPRRVLTLNQISSRDNSFKLFYINSVRISVRIFKRRFFVVR
ncbi:hypothetical protein D3C87_22540 [compost metagenome]